MIREPAPAALGLQGELRHALEGKGLTKYVRPSERSSLLEGAARVAFPRTDESTLRLISNLLELAISRMDQVSDRLAARELFGLSKKSRRRSLQQREANAGLSYEPPKARHTFRTAYKPRIIDEISEIILHIESEGAVPARDVQVKAERQYVPRRGIEQQFTQLRKGGSRVILFYGDAGTGKSTLASKLAEQCTYSPEDIPILNLNDEDLLMARVIDYLNMHGDCAPSGDRLVQLRAFARALACPDSPRVIILDGAQSWKTVQLLLPENMEELQSIVLITSREAILPKGIGAALLIQNMTEAEATSMIKARVTELADEDAARLANALDCRPLAIEHGCTLYLESEEVQSAQEFCATLQLDVVALFDSVTHEVKLTAIYRRLLAVLGNDPDRSHAWKLLLLLLAGIPDADTEILRQLWLQSGQDQGYNIREIDAAKHLAGMSLRRALHDLERLALISVSSEIDMTAGLDAAEERRTPRYANIKMHRLTHQILRSLVKPEDIMAAERVFSAIQLVLDDVDWHGGMAVPHQLMHWSAHVDHALRTVSKFTPGLSRRIELTRIFAFMLCCHRQWGTGDHYTQISLLFFDIASQDADSDHLSARDRSSLAIELMLSGVLDYMLPEHASLKNRIIDAIEDPQLYDPNIGSPWFFFGIRAKTDRLFSEGTSRLRSAKRTRDHLMRARWAQSLGSIEIDRDNWDRADAFFESSFASATHVPEIEAKRIAYETALRAAIMHLKTGKEQNLTSWKDRIVALTEDEPWRNVWLDDKSTKDRINYALSSIELHRLYQQWLAADPEVGENLTTIMDEQDRLLKEFNIRSWQRALAYDRFRAYALRDLCQADRYLTAFHERLDSGVTGPDEEENITEVRRPDDPMSSDCIILNIAEAKLVLNHSEFHSWDKSGLVKMADRTMKLGLAAERAGLPRYWQAEAIMTGVMLGRLSSFPNASLLDRLGALARDLLTDIGRVDRLALYDRVAAGEIGSIWLLAD